MTTHENIDHQSHILAYWQSAQIDVKDSPIPPQKQQALYHAGQLGYLGLIAGVFAAHNLEYGGVSSWLPKAAHEQYRDTLAERDVLAVPTYQADPDTRLAMRQNLALGKRIVDAALRDHATALNIAHYDITEYGQQNTGILLVANHDGSIPEDLEKLLRE